MRYLSPRPPLDCQYLSPRPPLHDGEGERFCWGILTIDSLLCLEFGIFVLNVNTFIMTHIVDNSLYDFYFNARKDTVENAKELRKNMTPAERFLWEALRNRRFMNLKFRRQHPVEFFVTDFICIEKFLVVEVDGGI
ncbi:MAG TPA: DUF559 domain-containing protein, partial [Prolixibacteraceae bacterium]|nr:DUF559 domain-containing protein [Prolixibacteraceae bacterium]